MKKTLSLVIVALLIPFLAVSQSNFHNIHYLDPYNPEYVKGEVLLKFKDEVQVNTTTLRGVAKTGIASVDQSLEIFQIESIEKVFKETRQQRQRKNLRTIRDFKGLEMEVPALFNMYKLTFDTIWDAKQIVEALQKDENIDFAEPNYLVYTAEVLESGIVPTNPPIPTPLPSSTGDRDTYPNDPLYLDGSQWYLDAINAPAAWDSVTGDTSQIIGIIDTGVDWDHPDLDDNIWTNWNEIPDNGIDDDANGYIDDTRGWDYINNDNDPNDDNSHGTHVAGIAAAEGNNGVGICGVAWNTRIMPIKMLQSSGTGNSSDFASAIEYASENGATVINMSLGSYGESQVVKTALENAYAGTGDGEGSMLVAAAGNDHKRVNKISNPCRTYGYAPMFPASYSWVIGVMAEDAGPCNGFSNWDFDGPVSFEGFNYEILAKGVGIMSCKPNGSYWAKSGTSMASPEVAGAVALMHQYHPEDSGEEIFAKLIQGANSGLIDIFSSLTTSLVPNLYYIDYTIVDTLPGCDGDGVADAGETIQLFLTVKNAGGQADSVWTKIRFGEFEDTTTANLIDTTSLIGSMSAYSTRTGELDPFLIEIDSNVAHNRDIVFEFLISSHNSIDTTVNCFITSVQNKEELSGFYPGTTYLFPTKNYLILGNTVFDSLIILPGTNISIDKDASFNISMYLSAIGTYDSLIEFTNNGSGHWYGINVLVQNTPMEFKYCSFEYAEPAIVQSHSESVSYEDCYFQYNYYGGSGSSANLNRCVITQMQNVGALAVSFHWGVIKNCVVVNNRTAGGISTSQLDGIARNNVIFNSGNYVGTLYTPVHNVTMNYLAWGTYYFYPNYYGVNDSSVIEDLTLDFFENSYQPIIISYDSALFEPPPECHGVIWKINVNDVLINIFDNPYNFSNGLGVIGAETLKFDIYFNRAMDTSYTPLLTFGVREPYTQHIVADSSSWSADSTIWTAYKTIDETTGDGIQRIRVANARDDEHFEIPVEDSRFEFVVQAAGAASIDFFATAGIGKVDLEWPPTPSDDALGYNLYRFYNLTDSTYSDTISLNTDLVLDTLYTDYNVIPDTTYHYLYKTLGTDMVETDYSKKVTATPFNAANGDANGDLGVDVMDITSIVSFMLDENPSPFLFDAADVNYDNDINVLDIIALVQLINGKKSLSILPLPEFSKETAYYLMKNNKIQFESMGNVTALQFKLKVKSEKLEVLESLKIFSLSHGFEFAYAVVDDHVVGILFSLSAKKIPEGITELFRFEGAESKDLEISEIFGGDVNGNYVPVLKKGEGTSILANKAELQANPNPFSYSTQINYLVPENGLVSLILFDLTGKEVNTLLNTSRQSGNYTINWNGTNNEGQMLKSGIYLLQLKIKSASGNTYNKEVKVVLAK